MADPALPAGPGKRGYSQGVAAHAPKQGDENFSVSVPGVSLPKGGGAIRGIGEKFSANPVTGTGAMSVPLALSSGRGGFGPQLSLSYDSGAGQGVFGLGWTLPLPQITRKTDKGLPRYLDAQESDDFMLSGAEDLVPVIDPTTGRRASTQVRLAGTLYDVHRYRPRIEGLFALIERWAVSGKTAPAFWRTISRDNITTWYGRDEESRISDPADPSRTFEWLVCQTHDDKGNVAVYRYASDNSLAIDNSMVWEGNRSPKTREANRYLKRILYGNPPPSYLPKLDPVEPDQLPTTWMFEAVFDYGDHYGEFPTPIPDNPLTQLPAGSPGAGASVVRPDPHSSHRAGFEIRNYRLCRRVLMFHHFPEAPGVGADCLVRSTEFTYALADASADPSKPGYSMLSSMTHRSYQRAAVGTGKPYESRALPPVAFTYSQPAVNTVVASIDSTELENLPVGTQGPGYRWIDLDGEGLSGVLTEDIGAWYYKPSLGDGRFGPVRAVAQAPTMALAGGSRHQFMDLAGNGEIDVVDFGGPTPGFHERDRDDGWKRHVPFASLPNIDWLDPNLRFIDLTGDGHADALVTEQDVFTWYPSLDERGFDAAEQARLPADEDAGARLVFADGTQTIFLADMCGDGLTDLVRIRNGEVCYWPNLGYGRFGRKVTMGNAPRFDAADLFDPTRIRLTDIDGSGPIDIIYLGRRGAQLYFNRSGNSFTNELTVELPLATENLAAVQVADLLGNGTACLVWNSRAPADAGRPVFYIDLMGGAAEALSAHRKHEKPHLLVKVDNNLGATTEIEYTPSTRFYLQDQQAGRPWVTRLPFPVHCVSRVTTRDKWRGTAFSSRYSYHHGYFDGPEREFRGFGRVEQVDVEDFGTFAGGNANSPWITGDQTLYQPPVKTITWYHTGAALDRGRILDLFEHEYFPQRFAARLPQGPGAFRERALPDPELPVDLSAEEWREALRACKGMVLRQEVYELDLNDLVATSPVDTPVRLYSSATHNCRIRRLQPRGQNRHAVFLVTECEALSYQHELALPKDQSALAPDPRIAHNLTLRHDELGNPLQSVTIGYGRLHPGVYPAIPRPDLVADVQAELHVAYTEAHFTQDVILPVNGGSDCPIRHHRLRLPFESLTFELKGIAKADPIYFSLADFQACRLSDAWPPEPGTLPPTVDIQFKPYHEVADGSVPQKRLIQHARSAYFDDADDTAPPDNRQPLPFGQHGPRGLKFEDYKLALTDGLLAAVFSQPDESGQIDDKLAWEAQPARGALPARTARDLLDDSSVSGYWSGPRIGMHPDQYWVRSGTAGFADDAQQHFYLPERYTDAFGNVTTLAFDALDLFVAASVDARGNTTRIAGFDSTSTSRVVAGFDYRVLSPRKVQDINGNAAEAVFDVLGLPTATAVEGKQGEGDNLDAFASPDDLSLDARIAFFTQDFDLKAARSLLHDATTRHVHYLGEARAPDGSVRYGAHPPCAATIRREIHASDLGPDQESPLQVAFEYSDGSGGVLMTKVRAEAAVDDVASNRPARVLIDDFSTGPFSADYVVEGNADTTDTQAQTGGMAGGERFWGLLLRGDAGTKAAIRAPGPGGGFAFTSDIGLGHRFDGSYGSTYIRHVPLSLDLSNCNALRFSFREMPRGLSFNVLLYFRGQADNYAQIGVNLLPHTAPFDVDFSFDRFRANIADKTRPADFSRLSGIYIVTQSGAVVANGGESFVLDAIAAVALPRWVVNGKTVLNNKGKPVKQFEPYFCDSQWFEEPVQQGVSPVIFYDAAGRVVRTEFPDGTHSRVEFSPWHAKAWDQNDTVLESPWYASRNQYDPALPLPVTLPGQPGVDAEQRAGWLAARHANTPSLTLMDSLGREVIAVAHNRVEDAAGDLRFDGRSWKDDHYLTFTKMDAEGKPLWIRDARGNLVMQYVAPPKKTRLADDGNEDIPSIGEGDSRVYSAPCYDIAGNLLYQHSMDAGDRWMLMDAAGKPMLAWDCNDVASGTGLTAQGRLFATRYDSLHRPTEQWLLARDAHGNAGGRFRVEAFDYLDTDTAGDLEDARRRNLIGQAVRHWDSSGLGGLERIDLSGQPAHQKRALVRVDPARDGDTALHWPDDMAQRQSLLDQETFHRITEHDALGRMVRLFNWHRDVTFNSDGTQQDTPGTTNRVGIYVPRYDERGALAGEWLHVRAAKSTTADGSVRAVLTNALSVEAIRSITRNAKGQKLRMELGNGTITSYGYDPASFRLIALKTRRSTPQSTLQDLGYTYDAVGNITTLRDSAQPTVWSSNAQIEAAQAYTYDAIYRLVEATGRENNAAPAPPSRQEGAWPQGAFPTGHVPRNYTQRYVYDEVGNFAEMVHAAGDSAQWTRHYEIQPDSNRLARTWYGNNDADAVAYQYDRHGSMLNFDRRDSTLPADGDPNDPNDWGRRLQWEWSDMLRRFDAIGGGVARYAYGGDKQRSRKHITRVGGTIEDRLYLDGLELYRRRNAQGDVVEEIESQHLFEGGQRALLVDDVIATDRTHSDGTSYRTQPIPRYQYGNHLGSVALELDEAAQIISYEEFHPWGSSAFRLGQTGTEALARRYRFTGMERDDESGLSYHGARYCSNSLARWLNPDANPAVDDLNLYRYAEGNPLKLIDPSGYQNQPAEDGKSMPGVSATLISPDSPWNLNLGTYTKDPDTGEAVLEFNEQMLLIKPKDPAVGLINDKAPVYLHADVSLITYHGAIRDDKGRTVGFSQDAWAEVISLGELPYSYNSAEAKAYFWADQALLFAASLGIEALGPGGALALRLAEIGPITNDARMAAAITASNVDLVDTSTLTGRALSLRQNRIKSFLKESVARDMRNLPIDVYNEHQFARMSSTTKSHRRADAPIFMTTNEAGEQQPVILQVKDIEGRLSKNDLQQIVTSIRSAEQRGGVVFLDINPETEITWNARKAEIKSLHRRITNATKSGRLQVFRYR